jgi:hypothetical protein
MTASLRTLAVKCRQRLHFDTFVLRQPHITALMRPFQPTCAHHCDMVVQKARDKRSPVKPVILFFIFFVVVGSCAHPHRLCASLSVATG